MAYRYNNAAGHMVINMTPAEAKAIGFGVTYDDYYLIDCEDNSDISNAKEVSYVAGINDVMNATKIESWCKRRKHYSENVKYETKAYNNIINKLKQNGFKFEENN